MRIDTLEDLYLEQLKNVCDATKQALDVTAEMANAASNQHLVAALRDGVKGLEGGISSLKEMALRHDESLEGEICKGMEGLAKEARSHALDQDFGEAATKDAMIITQYQRLAHYAIAGYGCLAAFADQLELDDDLSSLKACLDASYDGDRTMTDLATGGVNAQAHAEGNLL